MGQKPTWHACALLSSLSWLARLLQLIAIAIWVDLVRGVSALKSAILARIGMAQGWGVPLKTLQTALATNEEIVAALQVCLDLGADHAPCEPHVQEQLCRELRVLCVVSPNELIRTYAGKALAALAVLGPVTGAMARATHKGDARTFDDEDVRMVAYGFAMPVQAVSACRQVSRTHEQAGSACTVQETNQSKGQQIQGVQQAESQEPRPNKMLLEPSIPKRRSGIILEPDLGGDPEHACGSMASRPKKRKAADMWEPGQNTRGWLGRRKHLEPQAQVLLVNGYMRLKKLSFQTRRMLTSIFPCTKGTTQACTLAARIMGGLLAIPPRTVEETIRHVQCTRFEPRARERIFSSSAKRACQGHVHAGVSGVSPAGGACGIGTPAVSAGRPKLPEPCGIGSGGGVPMEGPDMPTPTISVGGPHPSPSPSAVSVGGPHPSPVPAAPDGFVNTLRAAMFVASHGLPNSSLPDILHLISAAGGILHGPQGRGFCAQAEHAAHSCVVAATLQELAKPLPGTGRPPDVEIIGDGQDKQCNDSGAGVLGGFYLIFRGASILFALSTTQKFTRGRVSD